MTGERRVAPFCVPGDLAPEPRRGREGGGGFDSGELDLDEAQPCERPAEDVDLSGEVADRDTVTCLLQAPLAGVLPEIFGLVEVEGDFDLGAIEPVAASP